MQTNNQILKRQSTFMMWILSETYKVMPGKCIIYGWFDLVWFGSFATRMSASLFSCKWQGNNHKTKVLPIKIWDH